MRKRTAKRQKRSLAVQVRALTRTIETKENQWKTAVNLGMAHNNVSIVNATGNGWPFMNPFQMSNGNQDQDMTNGGGQRIGDEINVQRVTYTFFLENALNRSKVYYRFMLVKCAKGDLPTRTTLFKGNADNKMIDTINTERFSVLYQKIVNVSPVNAPPIAVATPGTAIGATDTAGIATRIMRVSIPGKKFGRSGLIKYENLSNAQVKFYDYVPLFVCYDWYGTLQDVNQVGRINEGYCKCYFKDA